MSTVLNGKTFSITSTGSDTFSILVDTTTLSYTADTGSAIAGNAITTATAASPCVITTTTAHGFTSGTNILIDGIQGTMSTVLNGNLFSVTVIDANTFSVPVDTTLLAYTSGGAATGPCSPQTVAYEGSGTEVTAIPAPNYYFVSWSDGVTDATRQDINLIGNLSVTANFAITTRTITATSGPNGSITPSGAVLVDYNTNRTFDLTPATGYHIDRVIIDTILIVPTPTNSYSFTNVTTDHTISVTFAIDTFTITASGDANGTVTSTTAGPIYYGSNRTFTIAPTTLGYHVEDVIVDGVSQGAITSYMFTNVTGNHTISASFVNTWTLTYKPGPNGTITPPDKLLQTVTTGGSGVAVTAVPNTGYHFVSWSDGVVTAARTDSDVIGNLSVTATFEIDTFTLTPSADAYGTVTPTTPGTTVNYGGNKIFMITPIDGYHVADVLVDGVSVSARGSYSFTNVTANHTISATFAINTFVITSSSVGSGTISPTPSATVNYNASQTFTMTPAAGYQVASVFVDGVLVPGTPTSYTFNNVQAIHTISVTFANSYTLTYLAGANGTISGTTPQTVAYGTSGTAVTAVSNTGYHFVKWSDGVTSATRTDIDRNITVTAIFAINTNTITASAGSNGSITPDGGVAVDYNGSQTFYMTPATGYHVADVLVDNVSQGAITSYVFNNVIATHAISVTFVIDTFTIIAAAGANGSISPVGATSVNYGASQTFTITPSAGYQVATLVVDGNSMPPNISYPFTDVTANHTIYATFTNIYTLTYGVSTDIGSGNGTISGVTPQSVVYGGSGSAVTAVPDAGYQFVKWSDGSTANPRTDSNVTSNITVTASFAINTFTITASAGVNGTINPSGAVSANYGASPTFTITPNTGYKVVDLLVDGLSFGPITSYQFTNVAADHSISATFSLNTYVITAASVGPGVVSTDPSDTVTPPSTTVNYGSNPTFYITPAADAYVVEVLVDDVPQGPLTSYTFTNVTAKHTISATFSDTCTLTYSAGIGGTIGKTISDASVANPCVITANSHGFEIGDTIKINGITGTMAGTLNGNSYLITRIDDNSFSVPVDTTGLTYLSGGIATGLKSQETVAYKGTGTAVTAVPDTHYHFVSWSDDSTDNPRTDSNVLDNIAVTANFAPDTNIITATAGANGSINPIGAVPVNYGANQTFDITPATGYHVADLTVDGGSAGSITSYTFTNVTAAHSISVTFALDTFTITSSVLGGNGSITPTATGISYGSSRTFDITPATGYQLADVLVDSVSVGAVESYTFMNITGNHSIIATFVNTYTLKYTADANGTISGITPQTVNLNGSGSSVTAVPNTGYRFKSWDDGVSTATRKDIDVNRNINAFASFEIDMFTIESSHGSNGSITAGDTVPYNSNMPFTITANPGYHVVDVLVDGLSFGPILNYTFYNIKANHTISATFAIDTFVITSSTVGSGTISPTPTAIVNYGENQTFIITPAPGYHVINLIVDRVAIAPSTSYTFPNVRDNHTISATFGNTFTLTYSAGPNGNIVGTTPQTVAYGASGTPVTATPASNCHFVSWSDGVLTAARTDSNVTKDIKVNANFAVDTNTITASAGVNGSITPSGAVPINYGASQAFEIKANSGYHVLDVLVDNVSKGAVTSYTFTNVIAAHSISVTFAINTFNITSSVIGGNGSITASAIGINYGSTKTFTMTPNTGYHVADVQVDGASVGAVTSYTFTNITSNHSISVSFSNTYTLTYTAGANGTISGTTPQTVRYGQNGAQVTAVPNTGYHFVKWDDNSTANPRIDTNVTANVTAYATFAINTFTITSSAGVNGTITPPGTTTVNYGSSQGYTINPNIGYHVVDVIVDGTQSFGPITSYTFLNVKENHTISATFAINTFSITSSCGPNGTISPTPSATVNYNANQTFTITANTGYQVADVLVDGGSIGARTSYTFPNVKLNHTISATFKSNSSSVVITASAGQNGSISPAGAVNVTLGANQAFTITPAPRYHVDSLLVDGVPVGPITSYTSYLFTNVQVNHTISVTFAADTSYTLTYTASAGGTIDWAPQQVQTVYSGENGTQVTATPDQYNHFISWSDGVLTAARTDKKVTSNLSVTASFAIDTRKITTTPGKGGTIAPINPDVNYGSNQDFTIKPSAGYLVQDVLIDGVSIGHATSYTFTNVTTTHTVSATFIIGDFRITSSAGPGGSISPDSPIVKYGESQTFTMTPELGYQVADVLVDGGSVGARTSYKFSAVIADHTIDATFSVMPPLITAFTLPDGTTVMNGTNITVTVPFGTNVTSLVPTIELAAGTVSPASGVAQNFISPVTYTTTDIVGISTIEYKVTVIIAAPEFTYNFEIADGSNPDAATDNYGNVYVAYERAGSIYMMRNRVAEEFISLGTAPAIAVDSSGNIHVIYTNSGLKYKKRSGLTWGTESAVSAGGTIPLGTVFYSIDTDSAGNAHVAADAGGSYGHVVYTKDNGDGTWSAPIINLEGTYNSSSKVGNYYHQPVIRIDSAGNYHLAYELDYWNTNVTGSRKSVKIDSNSVYGSKQSGAYLWNAGIGLTRNALSLDGALAYIAYSSIATGIDYEYTAKIDSAWTLLTSFAGASGTGSYNSGAGAVAYTSSGVKYRENSGFGFSAAADIDTLGINPVALLDTTYRYVYYQKTLGGVAKIFLTTTNNVTDKNIVVSAENFNTNKGSDYYGASVGYKVSGASMTNAVSVKVALYDALNNKMAENTSKSADKINTAKAYSSAFILKPGTYSTSSTWNFGPWTPTANSSLKPAKAVITITDSDGATYTAENTNFTEPDGNAWTSLFPTLTYTAGANGSITGTSPQILASYGLSGTAVTAVADEGYHFTIWSDASTSNPRTDTNVQGDFTVTANFAVTTSYTLAYTAGAGGTISGISPQTVNYNQNGSGVTAVPNAGYHFVSWSDAVTSAARTDSNVGNHIAVTANFAVNSYTLAYSAGAGGSISGTSPQPVAHNGSGTQVTAVPNTGYHFVKWSDNSTANPRTDTNVTANVTVTATFSNTYTLAYTAGAGGSISGTTPQTVSYNGNGSAITAVPTSGYRFVKWSDDVTSASRTDRNVTGNVTAAATFEISTYTVAFDLTGNGTRTGGGAISQTVNHASAAIAPIFTANAGWKFTGWNKTFDNITSNLTVTAGWEITPPVIEDPRTQKAMVGVQYSLPITVASDSSPLSSMTVTGLPAGLKYDATAKSIKGVPKALGTKLVTITAKNAVKTPAVLTFSIAVEPLPAWAQGTFNGPSLLNNDLGAAAMTVTALGKATGKLSVSGKNYAFTAASYETCDENNAILLTEISVNLEKLPLTITVSNPAGIGLQNNSLDAIVLDNASESDPAVKMYRNVWKDAGMGTTLTPYIGYYTAVLPGAAEYGSGYLAFTVNKNGGVKITGKLADGTALSLSGTLIRDENGRIFTVIYTSPALYNGGCLFGLVEFVKNAGDSHVLLNLLAGIPLRWENFNPKATAVYGEIFERTLGISGGWYDKTGNLNEYYQNMELIIGADAGAPDPELTVGGNHYTSDWWKFSEIKLTPVLKSGVMTGLTAPQAGFALDPEKDNDWNYTADNAVGLKIGFTRATGVFKGSFKAWFDYGTTHTSRTISYEGVLTPEREDKEDGVAGRGFFLWTDPTPGYPFKWSYDFLILSK
jgi:hypothetical protein